MGNLQFNRRDFEEQSKQFSQRDVEEHPANGTLQFLEMHSTCAILILVVLGLIFVLAVMLRMKHVQEKRRKAELRRHEELQEIITSRPAQPQQSSWMPMSQTHANGNQVIFWALQDSARKAGARRSERDSYYRGPRFEEIYQ